MDFKFGKFQMDAVIPSIDKPRVLLEMKINVDRQKALMFPGLFNQLKHDDLKIGFIMLYLAGDSGVNCHSNFRSGGDVLIPGC